MPTQARPAPTQAPVQKQVRAQSPLTPRSKSRKIASETAEALAAKKILAAKLNTMVQANSTPIKTTNHSGVARPNNSYVATGRATQRAKSMEDTLLRAPRGSVGMMVQSCGATGDLPTRQKATPSAVWSNEGL